MFRNFRMLYVNMHVLWKTFSTCQVSLYKQNKNLEKNPVSGKIRESFSIDLEKSIISS